MEELDQETQNVYDVIIVAMDSAIPQLNVQYSFTFNGQKLRFRSHDLLISSFLGES